MAGRSINMPRNLDMKATSKLVIALSLATLAGCVKPPTWTNLGHKTIEIAGNTMITCYTDANIIDGERMEGSLCAHPTSGFLGGGEPDIYFSPNGRRLIQVVASETTAGVRREWRGIKIFLQCEPIASANGRSVPDRKCNVKANEQHLVSATFIFKD